MPRRQIRSDEALNPIYVSYSSRGTAIELRIGEKPGSGGTRYALLQRNEALELARYLIRAAEVIKG